jgi:manganese/zinc/iron transport system ATP- binding protein
MGLIPSNSGKVRFFGKTVNEFYKKIAYVGQRALIDWEFPITVLEVLEMGLYGKLGWFKRTTKSEKQKVLEVLEKIGLKEFSKRQISELSGGQQQRLFIGRALLQNADIYFLDEPFQGIDVKAEKLIIDILKELASNGKTIFVVHHDLNTVENYFSHAILLNMRLIASGPLKEVFREENLLKAFGQKEGLLEEAFLKQRVKEEGIL